MTFTYEIEHTVKLADGGWSRRVRLANGIMVYCVLSRGRRKWYGYVRNEDGETWSGEVTKSTGVAYMLEQAGLIDRGRCGRLTHVLPAFNGGQFGTSWKEYRFYCKNIKPKKWTGKWCPRCTELLESGGHVDRSFYNGGFGTVGDKDTLGRWAEDGGRP